MAVGAKRFIIIRCCRYGKLDRGESVHFYTSSVFPPELVFYFMAFLVCKCNALLWEDYRREELVIDSG